VRVYRQRCYKEIDRMIEKLAKAKTYREIAKIKEEAVSKGILVDDGVRLSHNHSFLYSKRFFKGYCNRIRRFVMRA